MYDESECISISESKVLCLLKNQLDKITKGVVCMNLIIYIKNLFLE